MFLGRLDPIKGAHHAITIARAARRRLIIAGNQVTTGPDAGYFNARIAPHIDGEQIVFVELTATARGAEECLPSAAGSAFPG